MGKPIRNLLGQIFGDLTVVGPAPTNARGHATWQVRCSCGTEKVVPGQQLTSGKTKSCGCLRKKPRPLRYDCTGQRYGMLVAGELLPKVDSEQPNKWRCQCDCGGTLDVAGGALVSGHTKSCGCQSPQNMDLTGQRFGRLVALERTGSKGGTSARKGVWRCQCDCGKETKTTTGALTSGQTQSCGCLHAESVRTSHRTHGGTAETSQHFAEYQGWVGMRQRCGNPNHASYSYYGGRGITVCPRWEDFSLFMEDMGPRPYPEATMERLDNHKNYEPGNVVWATRKIQGNNSRRNTQLYAFGKQTHLMELFEEVAQQRGIKYSTLRARLRKGWDAETAATEPVRTSRA